MTPEEETELKRRQKSRNLVLGGVLLFLAVVTLLNWFVGPIFGVPLLEMLFGAGVNDAYSSISPRKGEVTVPSSANSDLMVA